MEEEFFNFPILNENFQSIFERENTDDSNNSIYLNPEFESIRDYKESEFEMKDETDTKRREKRNNRVNLRKDDFDYNEYIREEMKKHDTDNMPESVKKHMIQKIRNRMSAQRSRIRAKTFQETIEKENNRLKTRNNELKKQVECLEAENHQLRKRIEVLESSVTTASLSEEEKSDSSEIFRSRDKVKSFNLQKASLFMILAVICIAVFPSGMGVDDSNKRLGGFPMLGSSLPQMTKQLKTIDDICRTYCEKQNLLCKEQMYVNDSYSSKINKIQSIDYKPKTEKQIELFDRVNTQKLICFDPENPIETENVYKIIVSSVNNNKLSSDELYYADFHKIVSL